MRTTAIAGVCTPFVIATVSSRVQCLTSRIKSSPLRIVSGHRAYREPASHGEAIVLAMESTIARCLDPSPVFLMIEVIGVSERDLQLPAETRRMARLLPGTPLTCGYVARAKNLLTRLRQPLPAERRSPLRDGADPLVTIQPPGAPEV
jgi:hypothetical protein